MKRNLFKIIAMVIMTSMLTACGTPNVVDTPVDDVVDTPDVIDEPIVDDEIVVDTPVDVSASIVYTNVQYKGWEKGNNQGIIACFTKPDGCDYAFFTAEATIQDDAANIKCCHSGITCSVSLDFDNLKIFDSNDIFVICDDNRAVYVAYSDDAEKILTDNTEGYSTIRNDHVEVIYNDTITDEQAQEILDSCVYYADGNEMQRQYQFMQNSVN